MKLPLKPIVLLVILSLTGIFSYQVYWLRGLYRTMHGNLERDITEMMRMSDYQEMMLRVDKLCKNSANHGEVSVSAGYARDEQEDKTYVSTTTSVTTDSTKEQVADSSSQSALRIQEGLDVILRDQNSMQELSTYLQRGLHAGLDILSDPDVRVYDSLLTSRLKERGVTLPHRLEHIYTNGKKAPHAFTDTLAVAGTAGYVPGPDAKLYTYTFDINTHQSYHLWLEPVAPLVLKQMSGILATSFVILLLLVVSFWVLVRTILRQKTLEEMKSDFTNNITHELKTPIAVAYAANDALLNFGQAEEKAKRDKYLRICQEQLQRLGGLVEQILSISMENRKTFRLHPETFAVEEMLETLVEQHKLKSERPVSFSLTVEPAELTLTADPFHFGNIVSNLIDNAIKYSTGTAEVTIRCRQTIGTQQSSWIEIAISDRGVGIAPEKLCHIFDKFYRVPTGNLHDVKGYGLGLFYVRTMTEKHGGSVAVKSEPGRGSTFTLRFPNG